MSEAGGLRFDHYCVDGDENGEPSILGRGAMGVTYCATDTTLGRRVALKTIDASMLNTDNARQRFLREARSTASLHHRNIATIFHQGQVGETCYYAMEFIDGITLHNEVGRRGRLPPAEALAVIRQAAQGLAEAERHGLVHRDIKPANIMLKTEADGERVVKLIDFGLVKHATEQAGSEMELTMTGMYLGTAATSSPEQCRGEDLDTRSDIYSLGITLWFALTGEWPYFDDNLYRLIYLQTEAELPLDKLKDLPAPVVDLLKVMLQKDRDQRPATCVALIGMIDDCLRRISGWTPAQEAGMASRNVAADLPTRASTAGDIAAAAPPKPGVPWLGAGIGATVGAAVVIGLFVLLSGRKDRPAADERAAAATPSNAVPAAAEGLPAALRGLGEMKPAEAADAIAAWLAANPGGADHRLPSWLDAHVRGRKEPTLLQRLGEKIFATHREQALDYLARAATDWEAAQDYGAALGAYLDIVARAPGAEQAAAASSRVERITGFLLDDPSRVTAGMLPVLERVAALPQPAVWLVLGRHRVGTDEAAAETAFRKGAAAGDPACMVALARLLRNRKPPAAGGTEWFAKAAAAGFPAGQYHHAVDLLEREGRTNDAIVLLRAAVSNRNADAMTYLGALHSEGRGVPKSAVAAVKLFDDAIAAGDMYACALKAALLMGGLGMPKDARQAIDLLQRGAGQTNRLCLYYLGMAYIYGDGVAQDELKGRQMVAHSAALGEPRAAKWIEQTGPGN